MKRFAWILCLLLVLVAAVYAQRTNSDFHKLWRVVTEWDSTLSKGKEPRINKEWIHSQLVLKPDKDFQPPAGFHLRAWSMSSNLAGADQIYLFSRNAGGPTVGMLVDLPWRQRAEAQCCMDLFAVSLYATRVDKIAICSELSEWGQSQLGKKNLYRMEVTSRFKTKVICYASSDFTPPTKGRFALGNKLLTQFAPATFYMSQAPDTAIVKWLDQAALENLAKPELGRKPKWIDITPLVERGK